MRLHERESYIQQIAQKYGLLVFYEGASRATDGFAAIVRQLQEKYSWSMIPISVDGVLHDGLPDSRADLGIVEQMNVKAFPALMVVDPSSSLAIPVAYGMVSLDQIEANVFRQFSAGGHADDFN